MKGLMSIIEVLITGMILFMAFLHFFPQYVIRTKWDGILLHVKVMDTLNTMDRLGKTYEFATDSSQFENFMNSTFHPEKTGGVVVWWRSVDGLDVTNEPIPYFTRGYKESMVDVDLYPAECSIDSNTVGLWHFNVDEDPTLDETDNDNDGDVVGATWTSSGKFGGAFDFDGSDDYIEAPHDSSLSGFTEFTATFWMRQNDITRRQAILYKWGGGGPQGWFIDGPSFPGYDIGFFAYDGINPYVEWRTDYNPIAGSWYHIAVVWKANEHAQFYVNGEPVTTLYTPPSTISQIYDNVGAPFLIGKCPYDSNRYFNGIIDEVVIYNKALTEEEIRNQYFGEYKVYSFTLGLGYPF